MHPRRSRWPVFVTLVVLVPSLALAARIPKSIPFVETGPFEHVDGSGPHRDSHNLLLQARAARLPRSAVAASLSQDVGDVAVVVDDGTLIIPPIAANPFDLAAGSTVTFVPGVDSFTVSSSVAGVVADAGADLELGDDDTTEVALPFAFPFFGIDYASIHVNSDGSITLGAGDSASAARDAARLIGGPPRISPLLADLDPTSGGEVRAHVEADQVIVTWDGVPQFGVGDENTFQAILRSDGSVDLSYGSVEATVGVVGVAEGNNEPPYTEIDFTADLPGTFPAGAIFEEFVVGNPFPQMNTLGVAQRFLETHDDQFDFIVIFTDFVVDIGFGAFAFHQGIKNETEGLGFFVRRASSNKYDFTAVLENAQTGPIDELESVLNMNRIGLYWDSAQNMVDPPIRKFRFFCLNTAGQAVPCGATLDGPPGASQTSRRARWFGTLQGDFGGRGAFTLGLNSAMSLMGQEAGHRWLAFPAFLHPGGFLSADLLGRSAAHWSFFFNVRVPEDQFGGDPRASSAEGNAILDLGPDAFPGQLPRPCLGPETTFLTEPDELIDGFTELDQYFMGVRTAAEVGPFWYADVPRSAFSGASLQGSASAAAQDDILFCGRRIDLTLAHITTAGLFLGPSNGPRVPALGDENDAAANPACGAGPVDVKTMAFVLLVPSDPSQHASAIQQVDTFRATWQEYANGTATAGRATFDTTLGPVCH